jgi:hypothetical protein
VGSAALGGTSTGTLPNCYYCTLLLALPGACAQPLFPSLGANANALNDHLHLFKDITTVLYSLRYIQIDSPTPSTVVLRSPKQLGILK